MDPDSYLLMSGIQHFCFCCRQWALIHLEQQWTENLRTAEGHLLHERCHDEALHEKRGGLLTVRGLRVVSHRLQLYGVCDVVEFRASPEGVPLQDYPGCGCLCRWSTSTVPPRQTTPTVCSFAPRPWRWKKCWSAKSQGALFSMQRPAAANGWT